MSFSTLTPSLDKNLLILLGLFGGQADIKIKIIRERRRKLAHVTL